MTEKTIVESCGLYNNLQYHYLLTPDVMIESAPDGGELWYSPLYWLQRRELSLALREMTPLRTSSVLRYWIGVNTSDNTTITTTALGGLIIGCQSFSPSHAEKMKEWALK